ncbi:ABC transporter substrate-binding protein [Clostridium ganghwense]|uniref:ABC transporter substrate-binding protein n=1 Tax=Clostridium ganghwense TaxID=312089 RepID=A0ABT4CJ37_9CLOT|nr:ABC transporter substrate-binding protein [Clostridium ganghwense]MCY6369067.1 ABC transporter substrate-binding protein [Clostridium ganghwense]
MVGKKLSILVSTILLVGALGGCSNSKTSKAGNTQKDNVKKIGITQIVEHPALDSAREGFIQALKDKNYVDGQNIKIDFQNAQGDMPTTQTIADKFVNDDVDLILAIATSSAQASYNATQKSNKDIPIVITAVTDPVKAGIVKSMDNPGTNVTGTSDAAPMDGQFKLIKKIVPSSKKIGIVYNTSEVNSEVQVDEAKKVAANFGFEIITQGITSENEIPQALEAVLDKIDVLYVIKDNMVASAMPTVTRKCFAKKIPVIGSESAHVKAGAIATEGIDYKKLGYETGLKAVQILEGKTPSEIPVETQKESTIVINQDAVKKLNIKIPEDISSKAEKMTGGVE